MSTKKVDPKSAAVGVKILYYCFINNSTNWNLYFSQNGQCVFGASRRTGRRDIRRRQRDVPVLRVEAYVYLPAQSIFPL